MDIKNIDRDVFPTSTGKYIRLREKATSKCINLDQYPITNMNRFKTDKRLENRNMEIF